MKTLPQQPETGNDATDDVVIDVKLVMPRAAMAAPADTISQKTSLATTGIPHRQFLETLRRPDFDVPVCEVGKLRVVDRIEFLVWLRSHAVVKPTVVKTVPDVAGMDDVTRALVQAGGKLRVAR